MSYILVTMQINVVVNLYRKYTLRGYFQSMTVNLFIYTLAVLLLGFRGFRHDMEASVYLERSILNDYIAALKSGNPTPGGGSVAAVMAQLSAALLHMACEISAGSCIQKNPQKSADLNALCLKLDEMVERADSLARDDEAAYLAVSKAFKMKCTCEEDKLTKQKLTQDACLEAAEVPLQVIALVNQALELLSVAQELINSSLMSDVAICICALQASAKSARYLVYANLAYLDRDKAEGVYQTVEESYARVVKRSLEMQDILDASLLSIPQGKEGN